MGKPLPPRFISIVYFFSSSRQIYHLPNIFLQHTNGTWLDSFLEFNNQIYEIFMSNEMKRLTTRVYRLSKSYSYFYSHSLSKNDRDYLEKLLLTLHNQQSKFYILQSLFLSRSLYLDSIISTHVKIFMEDLYFNLTSKQIIRRIYSFLFANDQQLDGRYFPSLILSSGQFNSIQNPLNYVSNQIPMNIIKQRDVQQITFSGKLTRLSAERILKDYWQNPIKQGLTNVQIIIIELQEYLSYSSK
jgi:hypothetical protein